MCVIERFTKRSCFINHEEDVLEIVEIRCCGFFVLFCFFLFHSSKVFLLFQTTLTKQKQKKGKKLSKLYLPGF